MGLCGNDRAPWPLSWVLFQALRREKVGCPHVGPKVKPAACAHVVLAAHCALGLGRASPLGYYVYSKSPTVIGEILGSVLLVIICE